MQPSQKPSFGTLMRRLRTLPSDAAAFLLVTFSWWLLGDDL